MRIRLKQLMAGPGGIVPAGAVVELPEAQARLLVASGQAEAVVEKAEAKAEAPPAPPEGGISRETAVSKQAKGREKRAEARNRSGK